MVPVKFCNVQFYSAASPYNLASPGLRSIFFRPIYPVMGGSPLFRCREIEEFTSEAIEDATDTPTPPPERAWTVFGHLVIIDACRVSSSVEGREGGRGVGPVPWYVQFRGQACVVHPPPTHQIMLGSCTFGNTVRTIPSRLSPPSPFVVSCIVGKSAEVTIKALH